MSPVTGQSAGIDIGEDFLDVYLYPEEFPEALTQGIQPGNPGRCPVTALSSPRDAFDYDY